MGKEEIERFMELTASADREGYLNRLQVLMSYDIRHRLHDLRPPALFLAAERDHLVPSSSRRNSWSLAYRMGRYVYCTVMATSA